MDAKQAQAMLDKLGAMSKEHLRNGVIYSRLFIIIGQFRNLRSSTDDEQREWLADKIMDGLRALVQIETDGGLYVPENHRFLNET